MRWTPILQFFRRQAQFVGRLIGVAQLSLIVASCALLVSLVQFYYGNLFAKSELVGVISYFSSSSDSIEERSGRMVFDLRSRIGLSLVNTGNRPSALLGLYYAFPPGFGDDCSAMPNVGEKMLGSRSIVGLEASYVAYPISATVVAPGGISTIEANLEVNRVTREKQGC